MRIGLAAAKGLCIVDNLPLIAVSSLEIIAARLPFIAVPVCSIIDARKQQVYAALYNLASGYPECLSEAEVVAPEILFKRRFGEPTYYTGDGAVSYADKMIKHLELGARCIVSALADALGVLAWRNRK